jgi:hypothetical protein
MIVEIETKFLRHIRCAVNGSNALSGVRVHPC